MLNNPRNRIVVFRLSQAEYQLLREACERAGARSISDFTRCEVLDRLRLQAPAGGLDHRFASLQQQIEVIQFQLNSLLQRRSDAQFGES